MKEREIKHKKANYDVYVTTDYSIFRKMKENRPLKPENLKKIRESIKEFGWLRQPILVNEKMEVIDGQHRLEACKELGLPVEYIIDEGLKVEECQELNRTQNNWRSDDYIHSFAERGNENYIRFRKLTEEFPQLSRGTISFCLGERGGNRVSKGEVVCSADDYKETRKILSYVSRVMNKTKGMVKGRTDYLQRALAFIKQWSETDPDRLEEVLSKRGDKMRELASLEGTFNELAGLYNYRFRGDIYANYANEYRKFMKDRGHDRIRMERRS